jgi:site-specific DNA recombinase
MSQNQTKSDSEIVSAAATAVLYLRVSSVGQMNKAHDPEGYSIPGQRETCTRYAERLGAEVVGEFVEYGQSGTSIRRGALQRLLAELPALQPTYVVVYDISRLARDDYDALWLYAEIERHGSKLESTLERIDDSPAGRLLYTVMAGVNAFRSRGDAVKVKAGLERKHAEGGTIGLAPIGYINTRARIEGREVRTVALDEERAPMVRTAFDAFASGEHSITTLCDLLGGIGLKTKETPKKPAKALSRSGVYRILQDRYYVGQVTRNGVSRPGRHPKLIDEATFEKVQELLVTRRLAGDRSRKHHHYLKGSLFCSCGRRLTWGRHRGNGGAYEYFCCLSNQARRQRCGNSYMTANDVERAVEDYYHHVSLTKKQCDAIRACVREQAEARLTIAREQSEQHTRRLRTLQDEQQKLLRLYYRGGVSEDVLIAEQARIETERSQARKLVETAAHESEDVFKALDEALLLIGPDCHAAYLRSEPQARRLLNQAIFKRLIVTPDDIEDEPQPVVADLHRLVRKAPAAPKTPKGGRNSRGPQFLGGHGSHNDTMVRPSGLEPPPRLHRTRPSTLRVYQFRHGRREARSIARGHAKALLLAFAEGADPCICLPGALLCEQMFARP